MNVFNESKTTPSLPSTPPHTHQDVPRVVVMCGIHEESISGGVLEQRVGGGRQEAGHRLTSIFEHQPAKLTSIRGKHCLWTLCAWMDEMLVGECERVCVKMKVGWWEGCSGCVLLQNNTFLHLTHPTPCSLQDHTH